MCSENGYKKIALTHQNEQRETNHFFCYLVSARAFQYNAKLASREREEIFSKWCNWRMEGENSKIELKFFSLSPSLPIHSFLVSLSTDDVFSSLFNTHTVHVRRVNEKMFTIQTSKYVQPYVRSAFFRSIFFSAHFWLLATNERT